MNERFCAELTIFIITLLVVYYWENPKRYEIGISDCISKYFLFIFSQIIAAIIIGPHTPQKGILTVIVVNIFAHIQHQLAHKPKIAKWLFFHDKIHHSERGRKKRNVAIEFISNVIGISLLPIPFIYYALDFWVCFFEGILYATYHIINQRLLSSPQHEQHHRNPCKEFGPCYLDVLLHFKDKDSTCENLNTGIVNCAFITILVVLIQKMFAHNGNRKLQLSKRISSL